MLGAYGSLLTNRRQTAVVTTFSQGLTLVLAHGGSPSSSNSAHWKNVQLHLGQHEEGFVGLRQLNLPFLTRCQARVAHPHVATATRLSPLGAPEYSRHIAPTARSVLRMEVLAVMAVSDCPLVSRCSHIETSSCWTIDQQPALGSLSNKITDVGQKLAHTIYSFVPSYGMRVNDRRWMNAVFPFLLHLMNEKMLASLM